MNSPTPSLPSPGYANAHDYETQPFGPGRLDAGWLESTSASAPRWILDTTDPHDPGHRDAFLGNGYIGQRISVEGDAARHEANVECAYPKCLVHGLWGELRLMAPPRWALLGYNDGLSDLSLEVGEWSDYRQALDMKHGILKTDVLWRNAGRTSKIHSVFYLSRTQPNVGVLTRVIQPDFSGTVSIIDRIDASHVEDASDWSFGETNDPTSARSMEVTLGPRRRRIAVVSRLDLDGVTAPDATNETNGKSITRILRFHVQPGRSYRVSKVVALVTDRESPTPGLYARTLVEAIAPKLETFERKHRSAWEQLWQHHIDVSHSRLQHIIDSSLYQFYSHLRPGFRFSPGPAGLSAKNWSGHVFWDSDLWMFPVVALLNPELARGIVDYRFDTLEGARRNARAHDLEGALFAWESAETGDETIPDLIFHHQHHVNSDIALAQWWYWHISGDDEFYRSQAAPVIIESARFWASRAVYNAQHDRYEIHEVCCADEFAEIRNNNAYTNYSAVRTLDLAMEACRILNREIPPDWPEIAAKMWIPFDKSAQRYLEYDGYEGETIKQADTALLIYPYAMPMDESVKANTVDYYREKYPVGNIMMAAAFDGIVDCELGRSEKVWESLRRLMPHFRTPFLLASESPVNEIISFATGLGGLLQLIVMGFAGVRISGEDLIVHPCMPPEIDRLELIGMHYRGICFDLMVDAGQVKVSNASGPLPFHITARKR